ncbi:cold shock domain-containing protein [Caldilinea sp.]|jgi:CspA family cold shock protein|uniref:cold shock domain-containing protein n=1 Tax=Caldilinea sp. TaxID=2293560 RepID=UPI00261CA9A1|nr:cold shock domain-containing protein [uncultured Caldilinea sp.]
MAKLEWRDEELYCARCGISFLWTQEEQRQPDAVAPRYCPGCRQIMPAPGRERGLVKWFHRRKQYGFIVRARKPEIYVHRNAVRGKRLPRPGDLVEFTVQEGERGVQATDVRLLVVNEPSS